MIKGGVDITEYQKKLVEENHNLIFSFLKKYDLSNDDYYDLAAIGLCKAALTYNNEISMFSTYAFKCMKSNVFNFIKINRGATKIPENRLVYYDDEIDNMEDGTYSPIDFIPSSENVENYVVSKIMCENYKKYFNYKGKKILDLLSNGYTHNEIGKIIGCSQPHISRIKKKIANYLISKTEVV